MDSIIIPLKEMKNANGLMVNLLAFWVVGQALRISNLLEDIKKAEEFAQYIENQKSRCLTKTEDSEKEYTVIEK
jgi:hypothetical protein